VNRAPSRSSAFATLRAENSIIDPALFRLHSSPLQRSPHFFESAPLFMFQNNRPAFYQIVSVRLRQELSARSMRFLPSLCAPSFESGAQFCRASFAIMRRSCSGRGRRYARKRLVLRFRGAFANKSATSCVRKRHVSQHHNQILQGGGQRSLPRLPAPVISAQRPFSRPTVLDKFSTPNASYFPGPRAIFICL